MSTEKRNIVSFPISTLYTCGHALVSGDEKYDGTVAPYSFDSIRSGFFYCPGVGFVLGFRFLKNDILKMIEGVFNGIEHTNDILTKAWYFTRGVKHTKISFPKVLTLIRVGNKDYRSVMSEGLLTGAIFFPFIEERDAPKFLTFESRFDYQKNEERYVNLDVKKLCKAVGIPKVYDTDLCFDDINLYGLHLLQKYNLNMKVTVMRKFLRWYYSSDTISADKLIMQIHREKMRKEEEKRNAEFKLRRLVIS